MFRNAIMEMDATGGVFVDWRVKCFVQKAVANLPFRERIYIAIQRRLGGLSQFSEECASKVEDWRIMASHLRDAGQPISGASLFEIGTGWYPTFPFCCYLAGAREVLTADLNRLLQNDLTGRCIDLLGDKLEVISSFSHSSEAEVRERYAGLRSRWYESANLETVTNGVIKYSAPSDARKTGLPASSIDVVFSNSVLEHVPPQTIVELMQESNRILRPGGLMFHSVDCGDHYSYMDKRLTQLNFLRYSENEWRRYNNHFLYQNRLRPREFPRMAESAGFEVVLNTALPTERRLAELAEIPIADCFRHIPPEELCITTIDIISKKPNSHTGQGHEAMSEPDEGGIVVGSG